MHDLLLNIRVMSFCIEENQIYRLTSVWTQRSFYRCSRYVRRRLIYIYGRIGLA